MKGKGDPTHAKALPKVAELGHQASTRVSRLLSGGSSRAARLSVLLMMWVFLSSETGKAQTACVRCEVSLQRIAVLHRVARGEPIGRLNAIVRTRSGQILMAHQDEPAKIQVFDSSGLWLRSVGRKGEGPGEYGRIAQILIGARDSVHVVDASLRRRSVLTEELVFARSTPSPVSPLAAVLLPGDRIVFNAIYSTRSAVGLPLHVLDRDGVLTKSFGDGEAMMRPDLTHLLQRRIAVLPSGRLLSAHVDRFSLQVWSANLERYSSLDVPNTWYQRLERPPVFDPASRPPTLATVLLTPSDSLALQIALVPRAQFQRGLVPIRSESGKMSYVISNMQSVYNSRVDVVDLRTGKSVSHSTLMPAISGAVDSRHVYSIEDNEDGSRSISIWRVNARLF